MQSSPEPQPVPDWNTSSSTETNAADISDATLAASPQPPPRNSIFFGRFGLRAGYGIAIVITLVLILQFTATFAVLSYAGKLHEFMAMRADMRAHPHAQHSFTLPITPSLVVVGDGVQFAGLLIACWLLSRGERRPLRSYGLGSYRLTNILPGAFCGFAMLSLLIVVLRGLHLLVFDQRLLFGGAAIAYGAKWLAAFLLVGLAEEYSFRGYLQYTLMRGVWGLTERLSSLHTRAVAFWVSAGVWSFLFALMHSMNGGENLLGLVQVFLAGVVFAYALWRTGSLWWGVGFHMTWDWAQSFLYGVPDSGNVSVGRLFATHAQGRPLLSGGADGPEGSIFATVTFLLTFLVIRFTTRPGMQPALEPEPRVQDGAASVLHNSVA